MQVNDYQEFSYTGTIQTFTVPNSGVYKLEVWGGKAGNSGSGGSTWQGGNGGKSTGYIKLKSGTVLYIVCGGQGANGSPQREDGSRGGYTLKQGGYNGGGNSYEGYNDYPDPRSAGASGGGATHIALETGLLTAFENNQSKVLIVAGGGGGASARYYPNTSSSYGSSGGQGGGTSGGGNAFGQGQNGEAAVDDGGSGTYQRGGGGGWSGGTKGVGGTGFIGNVPAITVSGVTYTPTTENGINNTSGKAKITLVSKQSVSLGGVDCDVYLGTEDVSINLGDAEL